VKLLLIIYGPITRISGGYLYDRKITAYLRAHGSTVDVLNLRRLPYPLCRLNALRPRLRRLFRRAVGYDALIVDELTFPSLCDLAAFRQPEAAPLIVLVHHLAVSEQNPPLRRTLAARLERRLLAAAAAVIVNSRTTAASVRAVLDIRRPILVCPPGSDSFELPRPDGAVCGGDKNGAGGVPGDRAPRLLLTGLIIPRKRHHLLLRLLAGLKNLDWELRLVGRAPDRRYRRGLERLIRKQGLEKRVIFTGEIGMGELAREYAGADIFVFPSSYEGFGISVAEAIRCGLPIVAFGSGALPEWVGAGLLVPDGDTQAFRNRLEELIRYPAHREAAAQTSRRLAAKLQTWEQTGRCFLGGLETLLERTFRPEENPR
jgi:glycosyltransferase involved in cell wall biosynthesis